MHSVQELDLDATAAPFFQGQSWVSRTVSEWIAFVLDTPPRSSFPKSFKARDLEGESQAGLLPQVRRLWLWHSLAPRVCWGRVPNQSRPSSVVFFSNQAGPLSQLGIGVGKVSGLAGSTGCGPRALSPPHPDTEQKSGLSHFPRVQ